MAGRRERLRAVEQWGPGVHDQPHLLPVPIRRDLLLQGRQPTATAFAAATTRTTSCDEPIIAHPVAAASSAADAARTTRELLAAALASFEPTSPAHAAAGPVCSSAVTATEPTVTLTRRHVDRVCACAYGR